MVNHQMSDLPMTRRTIMTTALAASATPVLTSSMVLASGVGASVSIAFAGQAIRATLDDNPSARDFAAMLPLNLTIEDYATNEKIIRLPRRLTKEGAKRFGDEAPGDLCYFIPWGNLALFYAGYSYSSGLIRLGRMAQWAEPLRKRGSFPVSLSRLSP